jgi:hypothetical protein
VSRPAGNNLKWFAFKARVWFLKTISPVRLRDWMIHKTRLLVIIFALMCFGVDFYWVIGMKPKPATKSAFSNK